MKRIAPFLTAIAAGLAFWLMAVLDLAGGSSSSIGDLLGRLLQPDLTTALLAGWAVTLATSLAMRPRSQALDAVVLMIPTLLGFCAVGIELLALTRGTFSFDRPEEQLMFTYAPRLMAASGFLGLTLSGMASQLVCYPCLLYTSPSPRD